MTFSDINISFFLFLLLENILLLILPIFNKFLLEKLFLIKWQKSIIIFFLFLFLSILRLGKKILNSIGINIRILFKS